MTLPPPDPAAAAHSARLVDRIANEVEAGGGFLDFARYMALALYAPGLGYYSGGAQKFGAAGDFVTAPELGPLFARTLATQVAQILGALTAGQRQILEAGAGSGRLAADLLLELEALGAPPERYAILELSGDLRERQRATIAAAAPQLIDRVDWLDRLPESFDGLVLGNEVLDAMPVHLVRWGADGIFERGVGLDNGQFAWRERPARGRLLQRAQELAAECALTDDTVSEIGLAAADWVATWAAILGRGALLLIDYGFPRREFYHSQRTMGTLMCHTRHRSHGDPFFLPGLQDITAHVDFTAVVESGCAPATGEGLELLGYTTQAAFLLACGLTGRLAEVPAEDVLRYAPLARNAQLLTSPAEMGELFKVVALGRGVEVPLIGFSGVDRSRTL